MPGLVGIVSINGDRINPGLAQAMRNAIRHRDWYKTDDYVNARGTVAISRVHLGVINPGGQPYSARNGKAKVFLQGDIYNDQVVNSNPLEFIYRLYEKEGLNFASFLTGPFVIVIVDEEKDVVLVANDRIADQPLFYFNDGRAIYFGREMKSLLLAPSLERELNLAAVAGFLANGYFTREHTLIEGVEAMDSATVLQIKRGQVTRHRYWKFELEEGGPDRGPAYYQEALSGLLRQAVRRCLQTDNSYGILLSGGYDSRGILGCYFEEGKGRELNTVSWGREEDIPGSDCAVAKRLAQRLGAHHGFYKLSPQEIIDNFREHIFLGEGLTDFPESYDVFHRIRERQNIDIVLRGDQRFGCSEWTTVHDELSMLRSLDLRSFRYIENYQKVLKPSYYHLFCDLDANTMSHVSSTCNAKNIHNRRESLHLGVRLKRYLNPLNYVKNFALESFRPLLDHDILDFVSTLPLRYRLGKRLWQETVVKLFPELYEEIAQEHNMINWASALKSSPAIERFVYRELIEDQNVFSEFINIDGLRKELDAFFAPHTPSMQARAKAGAIELLSASPVAYHLAHKCSYYSKKWSGRISHALPPERLIIRLLILKVGGDVILNYPIAKASEEVGYPSLLDDHSV